MGRRLAERRGQALVEFALVLPILLWLLVGVVDVAMMSSAYISLQHATREAVRVGITGASDAEVTERALSMAPSLDPSRVSITITPAETRLSGEDITVTMTYKYKVLCLMGILGNEVPLEGQLTARME